MQFNPIGSSGSNNFNIGNTGDDNNKKDDVKKIDNGQQPVSDLDSSSLHSDSDQGTTQKDKKEIINDQINDLSKKIVTSKNDDNSQGPKSSDSGSSGSTLTKSLNVPVPTTKKTLSKDLLFKQFASFSKSVEIIDNPIEVIEVFKKPGKEPIFNLESHMTYLETKTRVPGAKNHRDFYDREFETLLHYELKQEKDIDFFKSAKEKANDPKNRYTHVLPNEITRVLLVGKHEKDPLKDVPDVDDNINKLNKQKVSKTDTIQKQEEIKKDPDANDYINANFIPKRDDGILSPTKEFIATQAPKEGETEGDFWRMELQYDSRIIVCLTEMRPRKEKITFETKHLPVQYWPPVGESYEYKFKPFKSKEEFETYKIETLSTTCDPLHDDIKIHKIKLTRNNVSENIKDETEIFHILQYTGWDDQKVPENTKGLFRLFDHIDHSSKELKKQNQEKGPITVHCAGGIARTGTFITCLTFDDRMEFEKDKLSKGEFDYNIYKVVKELKKHRHGMVQQPEQYMWCHQVVSELKDKHKTTTDTKTSTTTTDTTNKTTTTDTKNSTNTTTTDTTNKTTTTTDTKNSTTTLTTTTSPESK